MHPSHTESSDFTAVVNLALIIMSTASVGNGVCHPITILSDNIVESDEQFTVAVETVNPNDMVQSGGMSTTVTITDNDGM